MSNFIRKLSSRKLWVAIVGIVVGLAAVFGIDENEYAQIAGVVGAVASAVSYIFAEGKVDAASAIPMIIEAEDKDKPSEGD